MGRFICLVIDGFFCKYGPYFNRGFSLLFIFVVVVGLMSILINIEILYSITKHYYLALCIVIYALIGIVMRGHILIECCVDFAMKANRQ